MFRIMSIVKTVPTALLLAAALFASPARASVELRVVAQPINLDIQALVTVTNATGTPVPGLTAGDFSLRLDGNPISASAFSLPPTQDPTQKISIIFVMDYSSSVRSVAREAMETAVTDFINTMQDGDFAAVIKLNLDRGVSLVREFTAIDSNSGGVGTDALIAAVRQNYPGQGSPILDGVNLAIDQFIANLSTLPPGPKSVIVITDGGEYSSTVTQSTVVDNASENSIPIFTIGVGEVSGVGGLELLTSLAAETGGDYIPAPDDEAISDAYATILELLSNEYLLTIPASAVTDCAEHTLEVIVAGPAPGSASVTFGRCDTTPDPFSFTNQTRVATGATVTSSPITISGIDGPAVIVVSAGEYSIGCGSTFTSSDGLISNGQTVCVRHAAASALSTDRTTTLTVGGVSGTFKSTTTATPPSSGGGGGGALGIVELGLGLTALWWVRRRRQSSSQIRIP